jgi:hypothetical protein
MITAASPASIITQFLIDNGMITDPSDGGSWPGYIDFEPDGLGVPDEIVSVLGVVGIKDGRLMSSGTVILHPGIQIQVRSRTHDGGWDKALAIRDLLEIPSASEINIRVLGELGTYTIENPFQEAPIIPLGLEAGTKRRYRFILNYLATLEETRLVLTVYQLTTLAHIVDSTLTAEQMEGWLHTNSGAGASTVRLTLPLAADGLHATFAQVDSGDFIIDPNAADNLVWSGGALSSGQALKLENPVSVLYIASDGNNRWIVLTESGTLVEE